MTSAQKRKTKLNQSKRRVMRFTGELGSFYVRDARKAIRVREKTEKEKSERSEARKLKSDHEKRLEPRQAASTKDFEEK